MSGNNDGRPAGAKQTVIEDGTEFKGVLSSKHPVVVKGKFQGDLSGPSLDVQADGVVTGRVMVQELRSSGEIAGEIEAEQVHLAGRVRDKTVLRAKELEVISEGDRGLADLMMGECDIEIGEAPDKAAALAAAAAGRAAAAAGSLGAAPQAEAPVSDTDDNHLPEEIAAEASGPHGKKARRAAAAR
jgi:cytoskeletal protein CcmA (bactofilin family)